MAGAHRMVARRATDAARRAAQSEQSKAAHRAAQAAFPQEEKTRTPKAEHGKQIWVFNHLQTNQVVYSLNAAMKNNASLRQLPYNGKKTVPSTLRKDLWHPLCQITFPHSPPAPISPKGRKPSALALAPKNINTLGLAAFQKLREYRRRHELEWKVSDFKNEKGVLLGKKARGRKLCDQKANAIADLAAVLSEVTGVDGKAVAVQEGESEEEALESVDVDSSKQVIVKWSDLLDAEYAEKWSPNVVHDVMVYTKNNRDPTLYAPYDEQAIVEEEGVPEEEVPEPSSAEKGKITA